MLSNVRVLNPLAHQKERALQASRRNDDLLGFDNHLALDCIIRVNSECETRKVQIPSTPQVTRSPLFWLKRTLFTLYSSSNMAPALAVSRSQVSVGPFLPVEWQPIVQCPQ